MILRTYWKTHLHQTGFELIRFIYFMMNELIIVRFYIANVQIQKQNPMSLPRYL